MDLKVSCENGNELPGTSVIVYCDTCVCVLYTSHTYITQFDAIKYGPCTTFITISQRPYSIYFA